MENPSGNAPPPTGRFNPHADPLLQFYLGTSPDSQGRLLSEILSWDDARLESHHDFIQWLFPNERPSPINPSAPVINHMHLDAFNQHAELRANLLKSFQRMLKFYGLQCVGETQNLAVQRAGNWQQRKRNWLTAGNHNHLRITRILLCLKRLGLPRHARAFLQFLNELHQSDEGNSITATTHGFWSAALED